MLAGGQTCSVQGIIGTLLLTTKPCTVLHSPLLAYEKQGTDKCYNLCTRHGLYVGWALVAGGDFVSTESGST